MAHNWAMDLQLLDAGNNKNDSANNFRQLQLLILPNKREQKCYGVKILTYEL